MEETSMEASRDPDETLIHYHFDPRGRLVRIEKDGVSEEIIPDDRPLPERDPSMEDMTVFYYNARGELVAVVPPACRDPRPTEASP